MFDVTVVLERVNELFAENRGPEAESLMKEAVVEALNREDDNSLLMLLNELIGYYRETSQVEASYRLSEQALVLMERMGLKDTVPYATTLLNIANAYRAGGKLQEALSLFEETEKLYADLLPKTDMLVASLYNNMSLLYQEMLDYKKAKRYLELALEIVRVHPEKYYELAATYTNLASTCLAVNEDREAAGYFRLAIDIFEEHGIENAHYSAALSSLGTYLYKQGKYEEAARNFQKAMDCMKQSLGENEFYGRLKENLEACRKALSSEKETVKGLALNREYYRAVVKPYLEEKFPDHVHKMAVGLVGEGSDCFGFDDEYSRDHDWGPELCIWVTKETYEEIGDALCAAYEELPGEYRGFARAVTAQGTGRRGVQTISGFYGRLLGERDWEAEKLLPEENFWQQASDASLAAAVNGEVFCDPEGIFTGVRKLLKKGYPERIQYLKLAECTALFSQTGQYNYERMLKRGEKLSAGMMLTDCMKAAAKLMYYAQNQYPPHDKWLLRGLENLEDGEKIRNLMEKLPESTEKLADALAGILYRKGYISDVNRYLDSHTPELLKKAQYASMSDEALVEAIVEAEYRAFDKVRNVGGRAFCQDDRFTFSIMRKSQYLTFTRPMLIQYLYDFEREAAKGHNLIEEKYGRMMESTAPLEYEQMKQYFPVLSAEKKAIIEAVVELQVGWMEEFERHYPALAANARSIHTSEDHLYNTSYETYLRGEISTYSDKMVELYGRYVADHAKQGCNLTYEIMRHSTEMYGYDSLEAAQEQMSRLRIR